MSDAVVKAEALREAADAWDGPNPEDITSRFLRDRADALIEQSVQATKLISSGRPAMVVEYSPLETSANWYIAPSAFTGSEELNGGGR